MSHIELLLNVRRQFSLSNCYIHITKQLSNFCDVHDVLSVRMLAFSIRAADTLDREHTSFPASHYGAHKITAATGETGKTRTYQLITIDRLDEVKREVFPGSDNCSWQLTKRVPEDGYLARREQEASRRAYTAPC